MLSRKSTKKYFFREIITLENAWKCVRNYLIFHFFSLQDWGQLTCQY
jgi:hypothetical protein